MWRVSPNHVLIILLSAVLSTATTFASPPKPHHRHATLDARVGLGHIDGRSFNALAMYLGFSTFYFGMGFYEETTTRKTPDSMVLEGIELSGIRTRRTLQMPFVFGAEVYRRPGRWIDFRIDGQFKGGLELDINFLRTDADTRIPGSPEANYFLGGGIRAQLIHPLKRWLGNQKHLFSSTYVGFAGEADVLFRRLELEQTPEKTFYSGLIFVIFGSKKLAML